VTLLFIFDMDNVLYHYDWRVRMADMTSLTGYSLDELRRRWWHDEGEWAAEAGAFSTTDDYLAAFSAAMGQDIDENEWVRIRGAAMTPWPDSIAAVQRASELGQVTLLTNNSILTGKHLAALAPEIVDVFGEHLLTSSHYGARKPDPIVYERVLEAYDTDAADAFFADDMRSNVDSAASVGITAHLFTTSAELLAAVEEFAAAHAAG
jgi:putative hydrolase of the HAD superfamily